MVRRPALSRKAFAAAALLAVSVVLHAVVVTGLAGRLGAGEGAPPPPLPVEVALLAPPPAPAVSAPATPFAAPAVAPRPTPKPRPRPAAPTAIAPAPGDGTPPAGPADGGAPAADAAPAAVEPTDPSAAATPDAPPAPPEPLAPVASAAPGSDAVRAAALPDVPELPAAQRHRFRVYWGDFTDEKSVARLEYRLVRDGDRYEIRTDGEAEGLISFVYSGTLSQVSVGRVGPHGLEPLRYSEQRGKRPERTVAFDPDAHRLTPTGGRGAPVPMPPGTQDRLSVFYQIGLLARAEPERFVAGAIRELPVATMRDVRTERFEVIGEELLMAPGGPIRALRLHRPPPPGTDDPKIDLWLGYDFQMLPVRLRVEDASRRVLDQVIERGG
jgi:hypothetical protein